jgi:pimeloyl-ACP methyl ester carboxylesterase
MAWTLWKNLFVLYVHLVVAAGLCVADEPERQDDKYVWPDGEVQMAQGGVCDCVADIAMDDGLVNFDDQLALLAAWGVCPDPPGECHADLDGNGLVDLSDLILLLAAWGECDSDDDGMPDNWEELNGLDPCDPADADEDSDADGLPNGQEYEYGGLPFDPDSDGDGVSDGAEVIGGSDPADPADGGAGPDSDSVVYVMLTFGDQSCHFSETWGVRLGGTLYVFDDAVDAQCMEPEGSPGFCDDPWECVLNQPRVKGPIAIARGELYELEMEWIQTAYYDNRPDYDWSCLINVVDADGSNLRPLVEFHENGPGFEDDEWLPASPVDGVFVHDPNMILGQRWTNSDSDPTAGVVAYLVPSVIEIFDVQDWGPQWDGQSPGISLADPDLRKELATDRIVGGAITDGASICVLRVRPDLASIPGMGGLEDLTISVRNAPIDPSSSAAVVGSVYGSDGTGVAMPIVPVSDAEDPGVSTDASFDSGVALYVPPPTFVDAAFNPGEALGVGEREKVFFLVKAGGEIGWQVEFELRRPPVVLAHGLNSSPSTWEPTVWTETGLATQVFKMDYESTNKAGYDTNLPKVWETVDSVIEQYRTGVVDNNPDALRYAASRVDWVGHSMGGVLGRVYIAGTEGQFFRKTGHSNIVLDRASVTGPYLNSSNVYAGAFRRFITIGSPLDGSAHANLLESMVKTVSVPAKLSQGARRIYDRFVQGRKIIDQMISPPEIVVPVDPVDLVRGWAEELVDSTADYTEFDDSIIDLQPGSQIQVLTDGTSVFSAYPEGHRQVLWHSCTGIASETIAVTTIQQHLWDGLFDGLSSTAEGVFNSANAAGFFETANGIRGDVVVLKSSQLNGQSEQAASLFPSTIHSGPVFDIGGTTIRPETNHPDIADRVRELLSTPAVGIDWQGDISR